MTSSSSHRPVPVSLTVEKNGNILVLHRGAYPILEYDPSGKILVPFGDVTFSEGKVQQIPAADKTPTAVGLGLLLLVAKLIVLSGAVVLVETTNAKLRLFRVPDLLSAAFILATLALVSTFLFR